MIFLHGLCTVVGAITLITAGLVGLTFAAVVGLAKLFEWAANNG